MQYKTALGVRLSVVGLGASPLSHATHERPIEEIGEQIIHRALDLGVNFIDVADVYVVGDDDLHQNERLVARALKSYKGDFGGHLKSVDDVVIATKGGLLRPDITKEPQFAEISFIKQTIEESYKALGGEKPIPIWLVHSYNENTDLRPYYDMIKECISSGLVKQIGLSNCSLDQVNLARQLDLPVVLIQSQHNPWKRVPEFNGLLDYCAQHDLFFLPWSPMGGGSGYKKLSGYKSLENLCTAKNCSIYSLVLAWLRQKSPQVITVTGAAKISALEESVSGLEVKLDESELKILDDIALSSN